MDLWDFEKFCRKHELNIFTYKDLQVFFNSYSQKYLRLKIHRWIKKGSLKALKRGVYVFTDYSLDEFEIAGTLYSPSYISLTSALSHYGIIPDVSADISSVTSKNTAQFTVNKIIYRFYHIKQDLFNDYLYFKEGVHIASREKAILDYFYFFNPSPSDVLYERLNDIILKEINSPKLKKNSMRFPKYVQNLTNNFQHAYFK